MHSAPKVSVYVPPSRWHLALVLGAVVVGLLAASCAHAQLTPERQWVLWAGVALASAWGLWGWVYSARGYLHWDGARWSWSAAAGPGQPCTLQLQLQLQLQLDFQGWMLVRLRLAERATVWLWLEQRSQAGHWLALRRAVVGRAPHLHAARTVPTRGQP